MHMKLCKGQDLTKIDFGMSNGSCFAHHLEQLREVARKQDFAELQRSLKGKGFFSRLIHKLAKVPQVYWVNV